MSESRETIAAISGSASDTRELGKALGQALGPGDLVLLQGNFGAGKTVLVQGIATGLGIHDPITSPSFVLMVEHVGEKKLVHVDFFRIERADSDLIAGIEDYLDDGCVVAIEWPDWLPASLAGTATVVRVETLSDNERRISMSSASETVVESFREAAAQVSVRSARE
jgi:tRNA threonylcarbamoyladenosine biosynthesis protein TsaE